MSRRKFLIATAGGVLAAALGLAIGAHAGTDGPDADSAHRFGFTAIGGGRIDLADYAGRPVLLVNTASRCGFTPQFEGLQALWEKYRDRGLVVLGVPSNSFRQELASAEAAKTFCEVNFSVDFPMTGMAEVAGRGAHPFYAWAAARQAAPAWNFHKILLDADGRIAATFPSTVEPDAPELVGAIEPLLR